MRINCGFNRRLPGRKGIEHRNVTGIEIDDLTWEDDHQTIRERLLEHRPEGEGWQITGYSLVLA